MRALAVDFGSKRIGVAVGEHSVKLATPKPALAASGTLARDAEAIASLAQREEAEAVVLGLPLDESGQETKLSKVVRQLGEKIAALGLAVDYVDETLTSHIAHQSLEAQGLTIAGTRRRLDSEAACQILERWWAE
ncbi:MAG: Holliday junction resolvase RuvX [Fimbriimonadaceae bacterium]|nr:Holliday junction resolvase RuvX [Fimbriimonadaceae bacterium]QYK56020.1 MAG: Holliday junction resolvase RuvX [Fimbriimonadaceae bacterium]